MMDRTRKALLGTVAAVPLLLGNAASAQTAARGGDGVEEITVTARRFEERLQTSGVSVSAFTASRLESLKIDTASDLQKFTPNLQLQARTASASQGLVIKIRGLGVSDIDYLSADPSVALYIDGIFQARAFGPQFELFDLERIEVLRGPQGTLYGKNALGGAINIVTAKPNGESRAAVDVTLGNYGRLDGAARMATSVVPGKLFASVAVSTRNHDGYYENPRGSGDTGDQNQQAARLALRWLASDAVTVDWAADYSRQRQHAPAFRMMILNPGLGLQAFAAAGLSPVDHVVGLTPSAGRLKDAALDFDAGVGSFLPANRGGRGRNNDDATFRGGSMTVSADLAPNVTLRSLTSYRNFGRFVAQDLDGTPAPISDQVKSDGGNQLTQELQLNTQLWNDRVNLVVGGFAMHENLHEDQTNGFVLGLADTTPAYRAFSTRTLNNYENTVLAAFANAVVKITDSFRITAGLRYGEEKKELARKAGLLQTENVFGTMVDTKSRTFKSATPKFGVEYELNENLFAYATASKGYSSGGYSARVNAAAGGIESYSPESLWSYEAGFKATLLDRKLRFNAAAFRMDYANIVIQSFGASPSGGAIGSFTRNGGKARVQGAEFELEWRPVRELTVTAGLGILDQKFLQFGIGNNGQPIDPGTAHFFDSPDTTANVTATYTLPMEARHGTLVAGGDWAHRSRTWFDNSTSAINSQAGYSLYGARLSYTTPDERIKLTLFGENLGNKVYLVRTANALTSPFAYGLGIFGQPRTFGARLGYKF